MWRFTRVVVAALLTASLGACATYSDSYYYAADRGYGDYYTSRYDDDYYDDGYGYGYGYDAYFGYQSWPSYYSVLWPVYSRYYDPWYSPGFYYGVTYFPRTYFGWGLGYRNSWTHYHAYSPYRWSFYDNYYDWHRYDYRYRHRGVRDHGDWRDSYRRDRDAPRYGSARNEAERLANLYGANRPYTRGEDWQQRQQGYYADGYRERATDAPRYPGDTGGDWRGQDRNAGGSYERDNDNWRSARESGWIGAAPAGRSVSRRAAGDDAGYGGAPVPRNEPDYRRYDNSARPGWRGGAARERNEPVYAQPDQSDFRSQRRFETREYSAPRRDTSDFGGGWGRSRENDRAERSPRYEAPTRSEPSYSPPARSEPSFSRAERSEPRDFRDSGGSRDFGGDRGDRSGGGERDGGSSRSRDEPN